MADISGNCHCCSDCALFIANDDTSAMDLYDAGERAKWQAGMALAAANLPQGTPVVLHGYSGLAVDFNCDYCLRDVHSYKYRLDFVE